jgi:hypothetical protein
MSTIDWLDKLFQVSSVFGRTGAVVAALGDYAASLISYDNTSSPLSATTVQEAIDELAGGGSTESEISVAPAGSNDNYSPTGWQDATHVVFTGTATITGLAAPTANKPRVKRISTTGTTAITIDASSTASTATNRVLIPTASSTTATDYTITTFDVCYLFYSSTTQRWHLFATARPDRDTTTQIGIGGTTHNLTAAVTATNWYFTAGAGGPYVITGIVAPTGKTRSAPRLSRFDIETTLSHQSASSTAGNRFFIHGGADVVIPAGGLAVFQYDTFNTRWSVLPVGTSTAMAFGATRLANSATAPTANQVLVRNSSNEIAGLNPGLVMARLPSSNSSTTARGFTTNRRETWTGSTTPSFTFSNVAPIDGATETIYFPSTLGLTTFTLSSDLDPTGTVAYAFDGGASNYLLTMQYTVHASGGTITSSLRKVR